MKQLRPVFAPRLSRPGADVDVAIVGAGATGIAAARRCRAEGLTCAVLEARSHVGGRCVTVDVAGHPVDLGAHWLHAGNLNPLVALGLQGGEPVSRASAAGRVFVRGAVANDETLEKYRVAFETAGAAIARAASLETDPSIADVLPDLGRWNQPVSATFALISGRPLAEVSAQDFPAEEFGENWFVRGGYGAYLGRLAEGLPVALEHPIRSVDWSGARIALSGPGGTIRAQAAIVTVPVALLAESTISFSPELPARTREAIDAFLPGTYEHVLLDWPDSPFREPDTLVKLIGASSSFGLMARLDGGPLHYFEIDHATAEAHRRDGAALAAFALEWLGAELGGDAVRGLSVPHVTDWFRDPWSRSAWAVAKAGRAADRATVAEPVGERLWIVGDTTSRRLWGTVGGAWQQGEEAASAAARALGAGRGRPMRKSA